jgi:uncharacterized protein (DUF1697 family)
MSNLVEIVQGLGYEGVWTYINSGNVVFDATASADDLERTLESAFETALGFEVTTFVRTAAELRRAVAVKPFDVDPGDTYFVTLLKARPDATKVRALEALTNNFDTLAVDGRDVHWRMHGKSTNTTLRTKDWDDIVGRHRSTSRNMTMLRKLVGKLDDSPPPVNP